MDAKPDAQGEGDNGNRGQASGIGGGTSLQRAPAELVARLREMHTEGYQQHRLVVVQAPRKVVGLTSLYAPAFGALQDAYTCLWIDMNDVTSADSLFETLLDAVHYRLGIENWTPLYDAADARRRSEEMRHIARLSGKPWIIFLNARETPGVNGEATYADDHPNGWIDAENAPAYSSDESSDSRSFVELLKALTAYSGSESGPEGAITVALLIRGHTNQDTKPKVLEMLLAARVIDESAILTPKDFKPQLTYDERQVIECARDQLGTWSREKLRLLQSLVLMQRPRLLATVAFLSSSSTGETGEQREMIRDLSSKGFLRHKPGGFLWLHSDTRQRLRSLFNSHKDVEWWPHFDGIVWDPLGDAREVHLRLATWYRRVLDASNAPPAVFETVYHLCQAATASLSLTLAERPERQTYIASADTAVLLREAASLLTTHAQLIQTQSYSRGSCRKLEDARQLYNWAPPRDLSRECLDEWRRLKVRCTDIMRAIAREVGEDRKAYHRHLQLRILQSGKELTTNDVKPEDHPVRFLYDALAPKSDATEPERVDATLEWMRYWRWQGMLGLASRTYDGAVGSLNRCLSFALEPLQEWTNEKAPKGGIDVANMPLLGDGGAFYVFGTRTDRAASKQALRLELLRAIEQLVAVKHDKWSAVNRLIRIEERLGHATTLAAQNEIKGFCELKKSLQQDVERGLRSGRELAQACLGGATATISLDAVQISWAQTRLLMHESAATDFDIAPQERPERSLAAMRLLSEAEGCHRTASTKHMSDLAMIELYRAHAKLKDAEALPAPNRDGTSFVELCRRFEICEIDSLWARHGQEIHSSFLYGCSHQPSPSQVDGLDANVSTLSRKLESLLADATRFLDRAEPILRERRRNVWWSTWLIERRMRTIALQVWASLLDDAGMSIPHLGVESAPDGSTTIPEALLESSLKMIRADKYRLATIVDAYASCAKAFQLRLVTDVRQPRLPSRQKQLANGLKSACARLQWLHDQERPRRGKADDIVDRYISGVLEMGTRIHSTLQPVIYC